jgi:aminoglycoside 3-N-acetyltransferase
MITTADITEALNGLGIDSHDTVFVHSDVRRCLRVVGDTREQKLDTILQAVADSVPNGTVIMPTFTYSFCRRELFDVQRSPSGVGVLSERFRMLPGVRRTADPIFSTAVLGALPPAWERDLFAVGDTDCFGARSVFAYLLEADAKLVFFGVAPTACTFIHHVEQRERVPYRYFKTFRGVVAHLGGLALTSARFYVRDLDDDVETFLVPLVERLRGTGVLAETGLDRGPVISSYGARAAAGAAAAGMRENPSYLLERGHPELAHLRYG